MATTDLRDVGAVLSELRCLQGRPFTAEDLSGGLTNRNIKVKAGSDCFVVRVASPSAGLLSINRDDEHHNSLAAATAGVGAPVIEYRPDLGVLVVGWIPARTCTPGDLRSGAPLERIAAACRRLHAGPRFSNDFDMFRLQPAYLAIVRRHGFRLPERYLEFEPHVRRIEAALATSAEPTVPCNNDLLAGNCLDDGTRVWLIDYEYSGNNDPCFELGNLWSESGLTADQLEELIAHYYGDVIPQKVARARLQGLMSKYGWTLWASIQDGAADIDFDFWAWGMEKYDRAVAELTSPDFGRLLDLAAGVA